MRGHDSIRMLALIAMPILALNGRSITDRRSQWLATHGPLVGRFAAHSAVLRGSRRASAGPAHILWRIFAVGAFAYLFWISLALFQLFIGAHGLPPGHTAIFAIATNDLTPFRSAANDPMILFLCALSLLLTLWIAFYVGWLLLRSEVTLVTRAVDPITRDVKARLAKLTKDVQRATVEILIEGGEHRGGVLGKVASALTPGGSKRGCSWPRIVEICCGCGRLESSAHLWRAAGAYRLRSVAAGAAWLLTVSRRLTRPAFGLTPQVTSTVKLGAHGALEGIGQVSSTVTSGAQGALRGVQDFAGLGVQGVADLGVTLTSRLSSGDSGHSQSAWEQEQAPPAAAAATPTAPPAAAAPSPPASPPMGTRAEPGNKQDEPPREMAEPDATREGGDDAADALVVEGRTSTSRRQLLVASLAKRWRATIVWLACPGKVDESAPWLEPSPGYLVESHGLRRSRLARNHVKTMLRGRRSCTRVAKERIRAHPSRPFCGDGARDAVPARPHAPSGA